jgi:hypothetical protein
MNNSSNLIGPCQHCGGRIEFPEVAAGNVTPCPHCGQETHLFAESEIFPQPARSRSRTVLILTLVCVASLLIAVITGIFVLKQHKSSTTASQPTGNQTPEIVSAAPSSSSPTQSVVSTTVKPQKALSDLKAGDIKLEKTKGSSLVYAVGTLKNDSDFQRFGVRIQLDLFNRKDTNVGTAQDYIGILEPHRDWQFHALVTDPRAVSAKVASIKEAE